MNLHRKWFALAAIVAMAACTLSQPAAARFKEGDSEYNDLLELQKEFNVGPYEPPPGAHGRMARPMDIPDIYGPGAVLNVGNVWMKVTNYGFCGNPFTNLSSDPSGQWPGASGTEYLNFLGLAVGAVNPLATDPTAVRRVSYATEWRPPTLDPVDRMYRGYDGIVNGQRFVNDDSDFDPVTGDPRVDEDPLDGRDNDGDGKIDEDFAAIGQEMYSCMVTDNTIQAIQAAATEPHVPLGLECDQIAWAYSIPGYLDFDVIQYDIYNRSGHTLDSVVIGWLFDADCGPVTKANYWLDDLGFPQYPHGDFYVTTTSTDMRLQPPSDQDPLDLTAGQQSKDSSLCTRYKLRVQGFSTVDDDGDLGKTPGVSTFLLIDHSIDPTGQNGPTKVGYRSFRMWYGNPPFEQGGNPRLDQQRYQFMTAQENIDPNTGFIIEDPTDQKGDVASWASIGPWMHLAAGGHLQATVAFGVRNGTPSLCSRYPADYAAALNGAAGGVTDGSALLAKYPSLDNALAAQIAFEGSYEVRDWVPLPTGHGREYCVRAPVGQAYDISPPECSGSINPPGHVGDKDYVCFDMDCDFCTGAYSKTYKGLFHHTWLASSPPPSPTTNMSITYNYSANPDRDPRFVPAGDRQVTIAWDNLSETTPDPKTGQFDFRGYKLWKVSNWTRPVGSAGPAENDWTLLHDFRLFSLTYTNGYVCPAESAAVGACALGDTVGPYYFIPQTGEHKRILLHAGDMIDFQSGDVISPDQGVLCLGWPSCQTVPGFLLGQASGAKTYHTKYPVGRYHFVDHQVKNGFVYFYSVTAYDSTGSGDNISILESRRSAVEAEEVIPQSAVDKVKQGAGVWVVPNPYRGGRNIATRPSAWDLTPNASDPTGTHIDFMGLPPGDWTIKIFTVAGDLVATLNAHDAVNASIRPAEKDSKGNTIPGYTMQQDNPNDGEASWNLISRNGQDIVSGIYLFTVEVGGNVRHRGKFVVIR